MSKNYSFVLYCYKTKRWNILKIHDAVEQEWITAEEFESITGTPFQEE